MLFVTCATLEVDELLPAWERGNEILVWLFLSL